MKLIKLALIFTITFSSKAYFIPIKKKIINENAEILSERTIQIAIPRSSLDFTKKGLLNGQNSMNEDGRFSIKTDSFLFHSLRMKNHNLRTSFLQHHQLAFSSVEEGEQDRRESLMRKLDNLIDVGGQIIVSLNVKVVMSTKESLFPVQQCNLGVDEIATLSFDDELVFNDFRYGFDLGFDLFDLTIQENVACPQ
jgi:hypothetical protein